MGAKEDFAARLKKLREIAGYTQSQLADKLGISRGSISFYENGSRTPDIEILDKVCDFFGVPTDYMLGYINTVDKQNEDIGLRLGLSDEAISKIENAHFDIEDLNKIIEHEYFDSLMRLVGMYLRDYDDFKRASKIIDKSQLSGEEKYLLTDYFDVDHSSYLDSMSGRSKFLQYQCNNMFNKILEDNYHNRPIELPSKEELERLEASYKESVRKYHEIIEEDQRTSKDYLKKYQEKYADEIKARNNIHKALSSQNEEGAINGNDSETGK